MHRHAPTTGSRGAWGALVVGLIFLGATIGSPVWAVLSISWPGHFRTADGVVTEVHKSGENDWDSTIRFSDSDHRSYSFGGEYGSRTGKADKVTVHYAPATRRAPQEPGKTARVLMCTSSSSLQSWRTSFR